MTTQAAYMRKWRQTPAGKKWGKRQRERLRMNVRAAVAAEIAARGSMCAVCGTSDGLEFHHRDPAERKFRISQAYVQAGVPGTVVEMAKCDLLCRLCHTREHQRSGHGFRTDLLDAV